MLLDPPKCPHCTKPTKINRILDLQGTAKVRCQCLEGCRNSFDHTFEAAGLWRVEARAILAKIGPVATFALALALYMGAAGWMVLENADFFEQIYPTPTGEWISRGLWGAAILQIFAGLSWALRIEGNRIFNWLATALGVLLFFALVLGGSLKVIGPMIHKSNQAAHQRQMARAYQEEQNREGQDSYLVQGQRMNQAKTVNERRDLGRKRLEAMEKAQPLDWAEILAIGWAVLLRVLAEGANQLLAYWIGWKQRSQG